MEPDRCLHLIGPLGELATEVELGQAILDVDRVVVGSAWLSIGAGEVGKYRASASVRAQAVPECYPASVVEVACRRHRLPKQSLSQAGLVEEAVTPGNFDFQPLDLHRAFGQGLFQLATTGNGRQGLDDVAWPLQLIRQQLVVASCRRRSRRRQSAKLGLSVEGMLD